MRLLNLCGYLALFISIPALAAPTGEEREYGSEVSGHSVVERGSSYRVWQKTTPVTNALGKIHILTNSYTEIATGLHYEENGQWVETEELIELHPNGAVAQKGPHIRATPTSRISIREPKH